MTTASRPINIEVLETNVANLAKAFEHYTEKNDANMESIKGLLEKLSSTLNEVISADGNKSVRLAQLEERMKGVDAQLVGSKDDRIMMWRKIDKLEAQLSLVRWIGGLLGGGALTWLLANILGLIH